MVTKPAVDADDYMIADEPSAPAKHGTTVQAGWDAFDANTKKKEGGDYPTDFKFTEQAQLIRFLDDNPFAVYEQHWVDRTEGRRSFVCIGDTCPLCHIAGDKPRQKAAFNVLVLTEGAPNVQILTAPVTLARQLRAAHEDPRRGPLSKYYWAVSRQGTGRDTQYTVDRVRATELAEEWDLDVDAVNTAAASATRYTADTIYVSPVEDLQQVARQLVS